MAALRLGRETCASQRRLAMAQDFQQLALVPVAAKSPAPRSEARVCAPAGPGWFDSSWDLRRGLEVREDESGAAHLCGWIDEFLRSQRAPGRTASPSASTAMA
jgi:hypothetical protein